MAYFKSINDINNAKNDLLESLHEDYQKYTTDELISELYVKQMQENNTLIYFAPDAPTKELMAYEKKIVYDLLHERGLTNRQILQEINKQKSETE
ncbi:hypothetical protein JFL43_03900 [Viridibacillus sp. YIM B01967]|uniref:Uncharacterized protein n=1 Tax=Viridibacillus soli TaxID=2798301 RepID=A0ABS1H3Z7_9BACL|nr:hypothetical protein [Viridibacillus soli]MBK3494016.1 hypothetical protein [Viridibacillus soli]